MTHTILRHPLRLMLLLAVIGVAVAGQRSAASAADHGVEIIEPSFNPQSWGYSANPIVVRVGDTVTWVNTGFAPHSVTAYDGSFDSGIMVAGAVWSMTVATPGEFAYYCILHPDMQSTIIVEG